MEEYSKCPYTLEIRRIQGSPGAQHRVLGQFLSGAEGSMLEGRRNVHVETGAPLKKTEAMLPPLFLFCVTLCQSSPGGSSTHSYPELGISYSG